MGCNHAVNEFKLEVKFHNNINNHISNTKFSLNNVKSGYILKQISKNIDRKKLIEILRYNKKLILLILIMKKISLIITYFLMMIKKKSKGLILKKKNMFLK